MRILLVEDDPLFARSMMKMLIRNGHQPTHAACVVEARHVMQEMKKPFVALIDRRLPNGDGKALAAEHPDVPVIVMSGVPDEAEHVLDKIELFLQVGRLDLEIRRSMEHVEQSRSGS